jgi:hypothetical protein
MIGFGEPRRQRAPLPLIGFDRVQLDASKPDTQMWDNVHVVEATSGNLGLNSVRVITAPCEEEVAARWEGEPQGG